MKWNVSKSHSFVAFSEYSPDSPLVRKIKLFEEHIKANKMLYKLRQILQCQWMPLELQRISNDEAFKQRWPSFRDDLNESTEETLFCAGLACQQLILNDLQSMSCSQQQPIVSKLALKTIRVRVYGHTPIVSLRERRQLIYGKLISVRGTVIRVGAPEIISTWLAYSCSKCGGQQAVRQSKRAEPIPPMSCKTKGCRAQSNFRPKFESPYTRSEQFQTLRIQESMQNSLDDTAGHIPLNIEAELSFDLVETVSPGDDVTITGIVKAEDDNVILKRNQRDSQANLLKFYIKAVTVVSNKNARAGPSASDFTDKEIEMIQQLKNETNLFALFVNSLCPQIFGHEMVKAGLTLALFGGSNGEKRTDGAERRTESHVLIVGDPGLGKSQMLQACANVSPRGIFVCGNSTTNAGLTVAVRSEKNSEGSMEAGALVLADQGVCCIDEFDKMTANYQSLLQVMEQQSVSVAKAGVLCALPARTCILAAANPSDGHYNKSKTVAENLKVWPTLLSRFDLVFILLDRADAHLDDLLTAHIQALHSRCDGNSRANSRQSGVQAYNRAANSGDLATTDVSLYERLKRETGPNFKPIPGELMQKYIGYARKNCFPALSEEAILELKSFYLELRKTAKGVDAIPVTTRQLEALIRLTQARARVELADDATLQHALDALAIFRYTMVEVLSSDDGTLNMKRNINGSGMSQATQNRKFLQMLQQQRKSVFEHEELKEIAIMGGFERSLTNIIDALNVQGFLIKRGQNTYRFCN